jgi:hypothetical protein
MSEVRTCTIETVHRAEGTTYRVHANVNVGGSLVDLSLQSDYDLVLHDLVERFCARLCMLAEQTSHQSLECS